MQSSAGGVAPGACGGEGDVVDGNGGARAGRLEGSARGYLLTWNGSWGQSCAELLRFEAEAARRRSPRSGKRRSPAALVRDNCPEPGVDQCVRRVLGACVCAGASGGGFACECSAGGEHAIRAQRALAPASSATPRGGSVSAGTLGVCASTIGRSGTSARAGVRGVDRALRWQRGTTTCRCARTGRCFNAPTT